MTSELTTPAEPAVMDPMRAAYLRGAITAIATALLRAAAEDLAAGPSTGSLSDRMAWGALRPWLPKLEGALLSRLSEADPAALERLMTGVSWTIEGLLASAPGTPEPRQAIEWDARGRPRLVEL